MIEYKAGVAELAPAASPRRHHIVLLQGGTRRLVGEAERPTDSQPQPGDARNVSGAGRAVRILYPSPPARLLTDFRNYATLLAGMVAAVWLGWIFSDDNFRAEIIPLLLFGMTAAIAYEKELALLLHGVGGADFVVLARSRAAAIRDPGVVGGGGHFAAPPHPQSDEADLRRGVHWRGRHANDDRRRYAGRSGLWRNHAGSVVDEPESWVLPRLVSSSPCCRCVVARLLFAAGRRAHDRPVAVRRAAVRRQTDISLLELGDVPHPLLQELVRRAPGTYNHSINVASIAESRGRRHRRATACWCASGPISTTSARCSSRRISSRTKGPDGNRHESLQPAMSTLIIIAHVKDGADLARQHHLPQPIIDFIEQHHGTTLVEYFYRREAQRLKDDPDARRASTKRRSAIPAPSRRRKEAGVLMLADAVESASRALVDPTPARIESLVHDLAMKRLLDGQFDECGLTLTELHTIEDSLVKSLDRRLSRAREVSGASDGITRRAGQRQCDIAPGG